MTTQTHQQTTAECMALIQKLGAHHARQIINSVVVFGIDPDEMEDMIRGRVRGFLTLMLEKGADPNDAETAAHKFYASIVKEGGRLAREMSWEAGHA
ncbi:hypothetical protein AB2N04_14660 [Nitratireductor sp. GISD-1A_MAKvit]|uniref:hypothetical protein n=1 Tax=Nitratireductor sp. GISD-1A_MAKvit TaxID=3234198 RepID=UPI003465C13A